ncbi:MAG: hypothetical protein KL787_05575 [Taibaiella sp.]|nr:hypothetical protein [Taibaiella sp.]
MTEASITAQPDDVIICEGSETSFSVTAINAVSYQWEYRTSSGGTFVNVIDDATYDDVHTPILTVNNVTSSMNGYEYRCRVTGGIPPDAVSDPASLTVNAYGTWNGLVSSSWDNTANWDCGTVPSSSTNVTIPSSAPNQPVIGDGVDAICNNINIEAGAELSIEGSGSLEILSTPSIAAGSLSAEDGEVIFSGTLDQNIPAGAYKRLQIEGGSSKNLTGDISVSEQLLLSSGWLILNDYDLTLPSSSAISGGSTASFVVSNSSGQLTRQNIGSGGTTGNILFPVGSNISSYSPLILNNSGTADNFTVSVMDGVFESYTGSDGVDQILNGAVNKTWFVSEGVTGGSNATIQLSWYNEDELPGFDRDNCLFSHYNGTGWEPEELSTALGFNPYFISGSGVTEFSPFAVASEGAPLSVNLISFEGETKGQYNELRWKTADESEMDFYILEKSADSKSWEKIGKLSARNEAGIQEYKYSDQAKQSGFYRLKMIEKNGQFQYSTILHLQSPYLEPIIFPNPVTQSFTIEYTNKENDVLNIVLSNIEGKVVFEKNHYPYKRK